jgi:hypothetical protein
MTRAMSGLLIGLAGLAVASSVAAQESLTTAKDLYASAAYEDALSTLTRLHDSTPTTEPIAAEVDQYRAFCLFALGRTEEAELVAESLITKDPLLELDEGDASPRVIALFAGVRKRLLPGLTRDEYKAARASLDRKDFVSAESQLTRTSRMLEEVQRLGTPDDTLGDLRVLVDGFLVLARSAEQGRAPDQRSQAPTSAANAPAAGSAPTGPDSAAAPPAAAPISLATSKARPAAPNAPRQPLPIYDSSATDVVPPVALHQQMPTIPPGVASVLSTIHKNGLLEVLIDQQGNVERAVMREQVHPLFDALVVDASRAWKYRPATKDGIAVRYLKTLSIVKQ